MLFPPGMPGWKLTKAPGRYWEQEAVPWIQPMLEQAELSAQATLGDDYADRIKEGRAMGSDEVIELILSRMVPSETGPISVVA